MNINIFNRWGSLLSRSVGHRRLIQTLLLISTVIVISCWCWLTVWKFEKSHFNQRKGETVIAVKHHCSLLMSPMMNLTSAPLVYIWINLLTQLLTFHYLVQAPEVQRSCQMSCHRQRWYRELRERVTPVSRSSHTRRSKFPFPNISLKSLVTGVTNNHTCLVKFHVIALSLQCVEGRIR